MLLFAVIIVIALCAMPLAAALNIEIEKPLRNRRLRPQNRPKPPDDILVLPQPKLSISAPTEKTAA
jgi:hypothetical protein